MDDSISVYGYNRPLRSDYVYPYYFMQCNTCGDWIRGDAYSTREPYSTRTPQFIIHERCAKLPKEVSHPFHSHPLSLRRPYYNYYSCDICKSSSFSALFYGCFHCGYFLDIKCSSLIPAKDPQNLINHTDSFFVCQGPNYFQYSCKVCMEVIEDGVVYFDHKYSRLLHESCANLPKEINHPFHPSHPLTLDCINYFTCYACGRNSRSSHYFCCSECGFYLHVNCAFLLPSNKNGESRHNDVHTHQHPLIKCDQSRNVIIKCSACERPCKSSVYVCIECHVVLDESCMTLPRYLRHPFHSQHKLTLFQTSTPMKCKACGEASQSFVYVCLDRSFVIDIKCAWPIPPTINSELHQHPLVFLEKPNEKIACYLCGRDNTTLFSYCLECQFYVHLHCLPELPRVVKHERHLHPLFFTDFPIKDDSDEDEEAELYCNACEVRRKLVDPTYYCADCHFVAHIHCLTSEILSHLVVSTKETIRKDDKTKGNILDEDTKDPVADAKIEYAELISEIARFDEEIARFNEEISRLNQEIIEQNTKLDLIKKQRQEKDKRMHFISSILNMK